MIGLGQHEESLEVLCRHAKVTFNSESDKSEVSRLPDPSSQLGVFHALEFPEDTPVDIRSKLAVVLINLKGSHLVKVSVKSPV